jgi:hypothetical protein
MAGGPRSGPGVIFRQIHEPGQLGLSDFTDMADLGVTVVGGPFVHAKLDFFSK